MPATAAPLGPDRLRRVAPSDRRARRGVLRVVATVVCGLLLLGVGSGAAWAWWSATAHASAEASALTVAPPTGVTCTPDSRLFFEDTVTIKWVAPATAPPTGTRTYTVTFVSASGTIVKTVPNGTLQLLVKWSDINAHGGWNQKQTITVRSSVAFPSTTWVSAAATPVVASTGSTTLGYNNLACATP